MLSCSIWFPAPILWMGGGDWVSRHHHYRTHDLRSGSQDHHPSKGSVQKTIRCNSTSNAPDDGRYVSETCRVKNTSIKLPSCIKLAFHFISRGTCTVKQPTTNKHDLNLYVHLSNTNTKQHLCSMVFTVRKLCQLMKCTWFKTTDILRVHRPIKYK